VLHALKAWDRKIRSIKAIKYIVDTSSTSSGSMNDESGISSDESHRTDSEMTNAVFEHAQLSKQPSASAAAEGTEAATSVSSI